VTLLATLNGNGDEVARVVSRSYKPVRRIAHQRADEILLRRAERAATIRLIPKPPRQLPEREDHGESWNPSFLPVERPEGLSRCLGIHLSVLQGGLQALMPHQIPEQQRVHLAGPLATEGVA